MKSNRTWIVLADARHVRIAVNDGPGKGVYGLSTNGLKLPTIAVPSNAPGMTHAPAGPNKGSISEPDIKGQEVEAFAKDIVQFLAKSYDKDMFNQLILIAPPEMLGALRQHLPPALQIILRADMAKDLTHVTLDELPDHLGDVLAV